MGISSQFATDPTIETKGLYLEYGDTRIRIARAGGANKRFAKALSKATKPHKRMIQADAMDIDQSNFILKEVYAKTIVIGWQTKIDGEWAEGIDPTDLGLPAGDLKAPTADNVLAVLTRLNDLFLDIQQQAQSHALFRVEIDEASSGN